MQNYSPSSYHRVIIPAQRQLREYFQLQNRISSFPSFHDLKLTPQNYSPSMAPIETLIESGCIGGKASQNQQLHNLSKIQYTNFTQDNSNDESDNSDSSDEIETQTLKMLQEPVVRSSEDEKDVNMVVEYEKCYCSVNFGEGLIKEMIMCSMFGTPVRTNAAIQGYRMIIERVTKIADNLPAFTDLTRDDRDSLLKENADLVVSLRGAIFFDPDKLGIEQVLLSVGKGELVLYEFLFLKINLNQGI